MSDEKVPEFIRQLAKELGGRVEEVGRLPDKSGFACVSWPLPKDHWLYADPPKRGMFSYDAPPMLMRMGTDDPRREKLAEAVRSAGRYAYRAASMRGKETDIDPDALLQNLVVGLLGYWTQDGLSGDDWANPDPVPEKFP